MNLNKLCRNAGCGTISKVPALQRKEIFHDHYRLENLAKYYYFMELERSNEGKHLIRVGNLPSPSIHHLYSSESSMELRHKNLKNVQYVYRSNLSKSFAHIRSQSRGEVSDPTNIIHSMKPRSQQKN